MPQQLRDWSLNDRHGSTTERLIQDERDPIRRASGVRLAAAAIALTIAITGSPGGACAQSETSAPIQPSGEVRLAGQVEIVRLLDLCSIQLGVNIEYDPSLLKSAGALTFRSPRAISPHELWSLTNRALASRGFTTIRIDSPDPSTPGLAVVKLSEAAGAARLEPDAGPTEPTQPRAGFERVAIRVRSRPASEAAAAVEPVLSKSFASAVALPGTELLIVSDLAERVDQVRAIVAEIERQSDSIVVESVSVRHVSAPDAAAAATQLAAQRAQTGGTSLRGTLTPTPDGLGVTIVAPSQDAASWRDLLVSADRPAAVTTRTYPAMHLSASDLRAVIERQAGVGEGDGAAVEHDSEANALIVTAAPARHAALAELFARLLAAPQSAQTVARSFVIRNRAVSEVRAVLEQLLAAPAGAMPSAPGFESGDVSAGALAASAQGDARRSPLGGPTPGARSTNPRGSAPRAPADPRYSPDPLGYPAAGAAAPSVSFTSDEGTNSLIAIGPSRLVEQVAELIEGLDVRQAQVMLEVLMISLTDAESRSLGIELERLTSVGDAQVRLSSLFGLSARGPDGTLGAGDSAGFTGTVLSPAEFSIVIKALQTLNDGRSLSMPKLLVANNRQATLDSVQEQPFASTNASNTVATTSFGGSSRAGTQVSLTPQIAEGDHLNLQYSISLSSFTGAAASANVPPPRQENRLQSVAALPDAHTVVVGGIDVTTRGESVTQVPILGDVPVLGEAFKSRSIAETHSRFFVFVRATILRSRSFEDLRYLSDVGARGAGIEASLPEVTPRVIR